MPCDDHIHRALSAFLQLQWTIYLDVLSVVQCEYFHSFEIDTVLYLLVGDALLYLRQFYFVFCFLSILSSVTVNVSLYYVSFLKCLNTLCWQLVFLIYAKSR